MAEEEKETKESGKKGGGKKKLILFALIGVLIIAVAGVAVMFLTSGKKKGAKGEGEPAAETQVSEEPKNFYLYQMEPIVVNLFDPTGKRYMQIGLALALPDKKYEEEIKKDEPILRDAIITVLSAMTPEEALQPQAKEQIKKELLDKLNEVLGKHIILAIYITQYIVE
ncbi:MAG: hypothetical protein GXO57_00555 [Thermodesulfobacteria bacterium]|nr:hypothetical protein [Thermodesulfobacteriota bacterium]